MRILFTFVGGAGHYEPLAPFARAARRAGHTATFACRPSMLGRVVADGFSASAAGPDVPDVFEISPLLALDEDHEERVLRDGFAAATARARARDVGELLARDRPDVVVSDEIDFGAAVAAERAALPRAVVVVAVAGGFARDELLRQPLAELRDELGLPPDPNVGALRSDLVLAPFPPTLRDPAFPLPPGALFVRPAALEAGPSGRTPMPGHDPRLPTVLFSLGTIFNMESGDLFDRVLAGLQDLPVNVIATVGPQLDAERFGPRPTNIRVARFIPLGAVLPRCDVVVSHGGSGTVVASLAHGLPSLLLPMGADQPHNARRGAQLGVARVVDPITATPSDIADGVRELLADPSFRRRARRIGEEAAALPSADAVLRSIELLRPDADRLRRRSGTCR